jgi:hypothetical protein
MIDFAPIDSCVPTSVSLDEQLLLVLRFTQLQSLTIL